MLAIEDLELDKMSLSDLTNLRRKINEVMCGEAGKKVKEAIQDFLNRFPQVYGIRWTQYTPYFNDGDACVFSVNEPYVRFVSQNGEDHEQGDEFSEYEDDWGLSEWSITYRNKETGEPYEPLPDGATPEVGKALKELADIFESNEDAMQAIFGEHVEVIVRQGQDAEIQDYDHD